MFETLVLLYSLVTLVALVVRIEWGLLLLLPLIPISTSTYRSPITGLNTINLLVFVSFGISLLQYMRSGRRRMPPSTLALIVFFVVCLIGWLIGVLNYRSRGVIPFRELKNVERWASFMVLYFSYFFGWSKRVPVIKAFQWMLVGVFMDAAYNIVEVIHPTAYYLSEGRTGGLFVQANSNGYFLANYCLVAIVLATVTRSRLARIWYIGCFGLSIIGIGLALSRAAFIAFGASSLMFAYYRSKRLFACLLLGMTLLVPTYRIVLPDLIVRRIDMTFRGSTYHGELGKLEGSAANRFAQYIVASRLFLDSPIFGQGMNGYYFRSVKYFPAGAQKGVQIPHSTFVVMLADFGLLGIVSFLWLLASLGLTGKRLFDRAENEGESLLGLFLMTVILGKLLGNLAATEFVTGDTSGYVWVTAGLVSWLDVQGVASEGVASRLSMRYGWRPRIPRTTGHG